MDILINPNVAYVLLAGAVVCTVLALISPGTGWLEILALFTLLLAGWGIYNNPFNPWAILLLLFGVVLFVYSVRKPRQWILLVVSIVALVIGSAFMFRGEMWWKPAVNPILAAAVSVLSAGFFWFAARKVLEAVTSRPRHDLEALIGEVGEAKSDIHEEGSIQVAGELWSARSEFLIPKGAHVRVVGRQGFILEVEKLDHPEM